ncbi:hypothetical protein [Gimesia panareensis]|uniref:hypothetical protein n=1 Tax=Gimesia panareensis TaxID=2527978 RepID=UPI00118A83E0|nr:hypothetical protein [Gimesia panareensis]QDU49133.1 hypothetical protein Pan110_14520 [Gimesia panareensis]
MDPVLKSLIWKEWQERKWTFLVCLIWILTGVVYVVCYESITGCRTAATRYCTICLVYSVFMSVFLSMRVSLSEVTNETLAFSRSLPVPLSRIAAVRLGVGLCSLLVPILLGALILILPLAGGMLEQVPGRANANASGSDIMTISGVDVTLRTSLSAGIAVGLLIKLTCISLVQAGALFLLLCVAGARRRSEVTLGLLGTVIACVWFILVPLRVFFGPQFHFLHEWIGSIFPQSLVVFFTYSSENATWNDLYLANRVWLPLLLNLLLQVGLIFWFLRRYGTQNRVSISGRFQFWKMPPLFSLISTPLPRPLFSLIWINMRQSVPLALAGLCLACFLVLMETGSNLFYSWNSWEAFRHQLPGSMHTLGLLWATVVGAGVIGAELAPGLGHFWRSRPISVRSWFWLKYLIGLLAVLIVLDGTTIYVSWDTLFMSAEEKMRYSLTSILSWTYLACVPLLHAMLYSLAVLGVCWWKKPVRGAVVAAVVFFMTSLLMESIPGVSNYEPLNVFNNLAQAERKGIFDLSLHHFPLVFGVITGITLGAALLAFRKLQRLEF